MKISISNNPTSTEEISEILKRRFSNAYSFKSFGIGRNKSIIARKSMFVGVQITKNNDELNIEGVFPSIPFIILRTLLFYGVGDFGVVKDIFPSKWINAEKELALFLDQKYNS